MTVGVILLLGGKQFKYSVHMVVPDEKSHLRIIFRSLLPNTQLLPILQSFTYFSGI